MLTGYLQWRRMVSDNTNTRSGYAGAHDDRTFLAENWRRRGKFEDVAFVFPSAPTIPITVNMGMSMPGWYDIANFDTLNRSDDEPGIMRSRKYLHSLINQQIADGIPSNRIILGGFSQGGAMSIFAGPTFRERLAGVFGLSCYMLMPDKFQTLVAETGTEAKIKSKPPIFMGHGEADPLVKFEWGKQTADGLKDNGFDVEWHQYPGLEHGAHPSEIDALESWVEKRLGEADDGKL